MSSPRERYDRLMAAYYARDFDTLETMIHHDLEFQHFNRGGALNKRDDLLNAVKQYVASLESDNASDQPDRVLECGNIIIREAWTSGKTPEAPGIKICSVMRFNDDGLLVEWKDYG